MSEQKKISIPKADADRYNRLMQASQVDYLQYGENKIPVNAG